MNILLLVDLAGCFLGNNKTNNMKSIYTPFILLIVLFSSLFFGCKKESTEIDFPNSQSKQLIGSWKWVESSGGFAGNIINPTTEGYAKQMEFSENGKHYEFKEGEKMVIRNYEFEEKKSIHNSQIEYMIKFRSPPIDNDTYWFNSFDFVGNDSLFLSDECYDCYGHLYVRVH